MTPTQSGPLAYVALRDALKNHLHEHPDCCWTHLLPSESQMVALPTRLFDDGHSDDEDLAGC